MSEKFTLELDDEAFTLPDAEALASAPDENSHLAAFRVAGER